MILLFFLSKYCNISKKKRQLQELMTKNQTFDVTLKSNALCYSLQSNVTVTCNSLPHYVTAQPLGLDDLFKKERVMLLVTKFVTSLRYIKGLPRMLENFDVPKCVLTLKTKLSTSLPFLTHCAWQQQKYSMKKGRQSCKVTLVGKL